MTRSRVPRSCLAVAALLAGCGSADVAAQDAGAPPPPPVRSAPPAAAELPDGWHWESYRGVEVGVPDGWAYGSTGQRLTQWCLGDDVTPKRREVDRPGAQTDAGCATPDRGTPAVDPAATVRENGTFVAFGADGDWAADLRREGDREVRRVSGVVIVVQARADLRRQILRTVRQIADLDANGCPVTDPVTAARDVRPPESLAVDAIAGVESVAACRYPIPRYGDNGADPSGGAKLTSSLRVEGEKARRAVAAIVAAPAGGGPDDPDSCLPEVSYGDEVIVLRVTWGGGRQSRIHLRYSGCDHNGFDDGVAVRRLTPAAVRPFIAGGNAPSTWDGAGKLEILRAGNDDLTAAREKCRCDNP